jgi:hypothetical protein
MNKHTSKHLGELEFIETEEGFSHIITEYNGQELSISFVDISEDTIKLCWDIIDQYEKVNEIARNTIIENFHEDTDIQDYFDYIFENYEEDELIEIFGVKSIKNLDIKKTVANMSYPSLFFRANYRETGDFFVMVIFGLFEGADIDGEVLEVKMDENFNVQSFSMST